MVNLLAVTLIHAAISLSIIASLVTLSPALLLFGEGVVLVILFAVVSAFVCHFYDFPAPRYVFIDRRVSTPFVYNGTYKLDIANLVLATSNYSVYAGIGFKHNATFQIASKLLARQGAPVILPFKNQQ